MKRTFISIDLPPEFRDYLKRLVRPEIRWIKWAKPENLHITLNFLGNLKDDELEEVKSILAETAARFAPFPLKLNNTRSKADMLWLIPEPQEILQNLQAELKERLDDRRLGKRERREYHPHVLLAKSKTGRPMKWQAKNFQPFEFVVSSVKLYDSRLSPAGAIHSLLQSFNLKTDGSDET